MMIVVVDEACHLGLEIAWAVVVLEHDPVLGCLVPMLDVALCLRIKGRAADVGVVALFQPGGKRRSPAKSAAITVAALTFTPSKGPYRFSTAGLNLFCRLSPKYTPRGSAAALPDTISAVRGPGL
jgi:hypothetical protein